MKLRQAKKLIKYTKPKHRIKSLQEAVRKVHSRYYGDATTKYWKERQLRPIKPWAFLKEQCKYCLGLVHNRNICPSLCFSCQKSEYNWTIYLKSLKKICLTCVFNEKSRK